MNVLLIRPPIIYADFRIGFIPLRFYTMFMTRYPPLGLMSLASVIRRIGHQVALIDAEAEELDIRSVVARRRGYRPDLIVGNVNIYNPRANLRDLARLKDALGGTLVIRGHYPQNYAADAMVHPAVDLAMTGKGYHTIAQILEAHAGARPRSAIQGVMVRDGHELVRTEAEPVFQPLDDLPFPARDLVDHRLYTTNISYRRPFSTMLASTGCPYHCYYCTDRHAPYLTRSVENVVAEMEECTATHGIREIAFLDPTFTARESWTLELCRALIDKQLDLTFTIRTRPDNLTREMVQLLAEAGCVRVSLGIESCDMNVLAASGRQMTVEAIRQSVEWLRDAGIMAFGFFMVGNKGETHDSLRTTLAEIKRLPLHFAQFFITMPLLNSGIHEASKQHLGRDLWRAIGENRYPTRDEFRSHENELTLRDVRRWTRRFYLTFYLSPRRWLLWFKLPGLWRTVVRHFDTFVLVSKLAALRGLRRRWPEFLLGTR